MNKDHKEDIMHKHDQKTKKQDGSKPIVSDNRKEVRKENTNHFTNRAPGGSK